MRIAIKVDVRDVVSSPLSIGIRWFLFCLKVESLNFSHINFQVIPSPVDPRIILSKLKKISNTWNIFVVENVDESRCLKLCIFSIIIRNSVILVSLGSRYSLLYSLQFWPWSEVVWLSIYWPEVETRSHFDLKTENFKLSLRLCYWPDWPQTSCVALVLTCRTRMWVRIMFYGNEKFW